MGPNRVLMVNTGLPKKRAMPFTLTSPSQQATTIPKLETDTKIAPNKMSRPIRGIISDAIF
jgi:hypothetical protein